MNPKNPKWKPDLQSCEFCNCTHGDLHADFTFYAIKNNYGCFIVINDLNEGNRSVTNDIEYVLWAIENYSINDAVEDAGGFRLSDFKIIYLDSTGIYDGVKLNGEKFLSFYAIQENDLEEAFKKAA